MFFQPQYLQDVRGHSAVLSGLMILPITAPMVVISPLSGRLIARFGARRLMTAGMACGVVGLLVLTQLEADSSYGLLLAGYLLFGVALGLVYAPMSTAAMAAMPAEKVGIASGVLAMDRVMAGTIALAATGAVFHALQGGGSSLRRRDRRLDLGPGRALRARRRPHLGLRRDDVRTRPVARSGGGATATLRFQPELHHHLPIPSSDVQAAE